MREWTHGQWTHLRLDQLVDADNVFFGGIHLEVEAHMLVTRRLEVRMAADEEAVLRERFEVLLPVEGGERVLAVSVLDKTFGRETVAVRRLASILKC